ncbi:hypothetical protein D3C84_528950 [compost metagenome]
MVEEQPHHQFRRHPEQHREGEHAAGAEADTQAPGAARLFQPAGAVVLPDTEGHGIGNAHRHHEGDVHRLDGDLVRRQLGAAQGAHAQGGEGEQARLHRIGAADGQAQAQQLGQRFPRGAQQAAPQRVGRVGRVAQDMPGQQQGHDVHHQRGDQADAGQAQLRQAEPAVDQRVVEGEVGQRAADADRHYRAGPADGAGEAAQGHEAHVAGQGEHQGGEEAHAAFDVLRLLAKVQQQRFEVPQQQAGGQRQAPAEPQPGLGEACRTDGVIRAMADCDQVAHGGDHADAEDRHEGIAGRTQATGGELRRTEQAHHHGIGEHHQHVGQLGRDQRAGQAQDGQQFVAYALRHE